MGAVALPKSTTVHVSSTLNSYSKVTCPHLGTNRNAGYGMPIAVST